MRLFQAALDTPLDSPFSAILSVHGLHFTVCAPSSIPKKIVHRDFAKGVQLAGTVSLPYGGLSAEKTFGAYLSKDF